MNWNVLVVCNFKCFIESEGFFKIAGSHIHCMRGDISVTVQYKTRCYYRPLIGSPIWPIE